MHLEHVYLCFFSHFLTFIVTPPILWPRSIWVFEQYFLSNIFQKLTSSSSIKPQGYLAIRVSFDDVLLHFQITEIKRILQSIKISPAHSPSISFPAGCPCSPCSTRRRWRGCRWSSRGWPCWARARGAASPATWAGRPARPTAGRPCRGTAGICGTARAGSGCGRRCWKENIIKNTYFRMRLMMR